MQIRVVTAGMLSTNCYIVADEATGDCAVIDPGAGAERILETIRSAGWTLRLVLLTHGHYDHILAAPVILRETGAPLAIHREDEWLLSCDEAKMFGRWEGYEPPKAQLFLADGMTVSAGSLEFRVLHTPGHTAGSCVFLCGDAMFSGDTLFQESCGRTDLETGSTADMLRSLKRLSLLEGDWHVYPGHEAFSTLQHEREYNPYMREALRR